MNVVGNNVQSFGGIICTGPWRRMAVWETTWLFDLVRITVLNTHCRIKTLCRKHLIHQKFPKLTNKREISTCTSYWHSLIQTSCLQRRIQNQYRTYRWRNFKRLFYFTMFQNFQSYFILSKSNKPTSWLKIHTEFSAKREEKSQKSLRIE